MAASGVEVSVPATGETPSEMGSVAFRPQAVAPITRPVGMKLEIPMKAVVKVLP